MSSLPEPSLSLRALPSPQGGLPPHLVSFNPDRCFNPTHSQCLFASCHRTPRTWPLIHNIRGFRQGVQLLRPCQLGRAGT